VELPRRRDQGRERRRPPDDINPLGQTWGAAAFSPRGLRATGYAPFRASVRASMRHADAVRIDHFMSAQRLFCVPEGENATKGAYVHYPCAEMRGVIALESVRNRCMVIGEDLGTVPPGFRERMADAAALSYKVFYFEREHGGRLVKPERLPRQALVTATTHDLPTLGGYWQGRDLDWRDKLNFYRKLEERPAAREERARDRGRMVEALIELGLLPHGTPADRDMPAGFFAAVYASLARSACVLLMVAAEDLVGEIEQPNLPGTFDAHPNWRRKLAVALDDLGSDPRVAAISAAIRRERGP
jgi:4-alpha-glucanotransferase